MNAVPASLPKADVPQRLVFRRLRADVVVGAEAGPRWLGGRWVGPSAARVDELLLATTGGPLAARLLEPSEGRVDLWSGGSTIVTGQHGCVRHATDGTWLHGVAEIEDREGGHGGGLQAAAHRLYADLFELLAAGPCPHPLRLWNYFPGINREVGGSERYRQFNAGRQQAFVEARRSAFEGSPAASALGTQDGPLRVYFLAGRVSPLAVENPRQVSAYRYPATYGPRTPTFSRAALVEVGGGQTALFISGTASIVGHATVHVGDVQRQTEECLRNIAAVRDIAAARAGLAFPLGALVATVYLRRADDLAAVRQVFERTVGGDSTAARDAVYLQADICRADLLVEIEAHLITEEGPAA